MASPRRSAEFRTRGRDSAALLKRIADGDESAFATLYDMTCGLIYGLLLRILGNTAVAEQVLETVYLEVWEQAATYDGEREKPMSWLITMAHSRAITRLKATKHDQQVQACPSKIGDRIMATNHKTYEAVSDEQRIVRSALAALPSVQQQMIELAYFSGLRQNEIAARLGLPLQSVQTGLRAGMMGLRDALESHLLQPA